MKKLKMLALAGAFTLAAACPVLADDLVTKTGNESQSEKYVVDFSGLTEEEVASITTIDAHINLDSDYVNGCIGGNVDGAWATSGQLELKETGYFVWEVPGSLVNKNEAEELDPYVEVQLWWVGDVEEGKPGTAAVTRVSLYDKDENLVKTLPVNEEEEPGDGETPVAVPPVSVEITHTGQGDKDFPKTPSYTYTVQGDNTASLSVAVVYEEAFGDGAFNAWCGNAIRVTKADGSKIYYGFGGESVGWTASVEEDGDNVVPQAGDEGYFALDETGAGIFAIPVVKGDVVDFYDFCWNNITDATHFTLYLGEAPESEPQGDAAPVVLLSVVAILGLAVAFKSRKTA